MLKNHKYSILILLTISLALGIYFAFQNDACKDRIISLLISNNTFLNESFSSLQLPIVSAHSQGVEKSVFTPSNTISIAISGKNVPFDTSYGFPFIDDNNRVQIPLRKISESFDADVNWNPEDKSVSILKNSTTLVFFVSKKTVTINGVDVLLDTDAKLINSRVYIPLRVFSEIFNFDVSWNALSKGVSLEITKKNPLINQLKLDIYNVPKKAVYYMQSSDLEAIIAFNPKIAIVDPECIKSTSEQHNYTKSDTARLLKNGIVPISYISVGEAEDYRSYWKNIFGSNLLGAENSDWKGNYNVRFWEDEWQSITLKQLDGIMEKGFKGAFLDLVDCYYYWGTYTNKTSTDPVDVKAAALRMISFVSKISKYCKAKDSDFQIIVQNATSILDYDDQHIYLSAVDGISIESLWYNMTNRVAEDDTEHRLSYLKKFKEANKYVIVTDYVYDPNDTVSNNDTRVERFIRKCTENGFYYYPSYSDRQMDKLFTNIPD